ncbi:MAG: hypothetical protein P0Y53_12215 [Candidatus Pseudobacter hemicellulosilyticus]|uniref:Uncharacterized protein n=1 Tax=Candidatus Pseudobacter hemicellulosilyticus TaxID=3121375 RepID=A0AAJ5WZH3_9BACT|nr:MAG: hypothetical protein P0Y53_12215 [Pseudobacter sp.]
MKKLLSCAVATVLVLLLQGNVPAPVNPSSFTQQVPAAKAPATVNYTWYYDSWYTQPVGIVCSLGEELDRLRSQWPGYTFSAVYYFGLYAFEYGWHSYSTTTIIYSDFTW